MLFSSFVFLFCFLPFTLIVYFLLKTEYRNFFLLIMSLLFYAWGEPSFVFVMITSIFINYIVGVLLGKTLERSQADKVKPSISKVILAIGIIGNLALLFYFKYYTFLFVQITDFLKLTGLAQADWVIKEVLLPIGISFFTFQGLSYLVDVYRGDAKPQYNFIKLALYIALFPQLIAGPIVRYSPIEEQLSSRSVNLESFSSGLKLFMVGLGKKVLVANTLGAVADQAFAYPVDSVGFWLAWLGIICYSFQIYFDFSGYSDMAIGLGRMFGFTFPLNFNYPYISKSMTEFWRRWHISLSSWFRDYLYISLGGNRVSRQRMYMNLFIVFAATGIWHGANWTFLVWGLWHGLFLIIEKFLNVKNWQWNLWKTAVRRFYVIMVFIIGWVFFRSDTIGYAFQYLQAMFSFDMTVNWKLLEQLNLRTIFFLVVALFASTPIFKSLFERKYLGELVALFLFICSIVFLSDATYNPFLYFRF